MIENWNLGADLKVSKAGSDHLIYAIAYPHSVRDSAGEWTDPAEIERAAHLATGDLKVNIEHEGPDLTSLGLVRVAESFISPVRYELGGSIVEKGQWVLALKIMSDDLWKRVKGPDADLAGVSIEGRAKRTPDGKLVDLDVQAVALCRRPCSGLKFLMTKSEGNNVMTAEDRIKILRLIDSIEVRLEEAKQEYLAKKNGLEGIMSDPDAASDFLKSNMDSDEALRAALNRYCAKFEEIMRREFGMAPKGGWDTPDRPRDDGPDQRTLRAEQEAAQRDNLQQCRADNEHLIRRGRTLG